MKFTITVVCALVGVHQAQYAADNPEEVPRPYNYQFGVQDEYTKSNFAKTESQDDRGNVKGSFVIALPDGRIQTTTYTADPIQGFIAEVSTRASQCTLIHLQEAIQGK